MPLALAGLIAVAYGPSTFAATAATPSAVEEITVTAQRTEENIQDVPIAVSAFTGQMLEQKQIINPSDLQLNTPNVSFTATNFGGSSFSIRGIGNLVIAASGNSGVSTHLNEIAMPTNLAAYEFVDMERVEVLRGPQGTLFGRNATGGVVNMVTAKPNVDDVSGNIDAEYGSYADERFKGALNVPITDTFALRAAGMKLKRDGYTENTANGQIGCKRGTGPEYPTGAPPCDPTTIQGIDNDIDGRDLYTYRVTGLWNATEKATLWALYSKFHENDDKTRITNQVCQTNPLPLQGCLPDGFGFQKPNSGATSGGIYGGLDQAVLLGRPAQPDGFPVPSTGFRKMHTDFEPVYKYDEDLYEANFNYDFDKFSVNLSGGYLKSDWVFQQDYNMDVGMYLNPTALNPTGYWPTSHPAGEASADWTNSACNYVDGTSGIFGSTNPYAPGNGGCQANADTTRSIAYDQSDGEATYWTYEGKVATHFDGKLNFMVGANYAENSGNGDYYVAANTLDIIGLYGVPLIGFPQLYPTMFNSTGDPNGGTSGDSTAVFGEVYFQLTDSFKITGGLRYNDDNVEVSDTSVSFASLNACTIGSAPVAAALNCSAANPRVWQRAGLASFYNPAAMGPCIATPTTCTASQASALALANYYGVTDDYLAGLALGGFAGYSAALQSLSGVPIVPLPGELRALTGSPSKSDWQETTGRIGFDWQVGDSNMVYAFYTRGYKPGGFNSPLSPAFISTTNAKYTFEPEKVDAYEIGSKNAFFDNSVVLNGAIFYYDYKGLQVSRIVNNSSINANMDAEIYGAELETVYIPSFLPALEIDVAYSYLHTEIADEQAVDPLDRTGGNPEWITLNNINTAGGSGTGVNYVARISGGTGLAGDLPITQAVIDDAYAHCAAFASAADGNIGDPATPGQCTPLPSATVPAPLPRPFIPVADGTVYPAGSAFPGMPSYFQQAFLAARGVAFSSGLNRSIEGNEIPNAPENKIHIGIAYTFTFSFGTITPRWDYSWQGDSYAREFNTVGDEIDSWDQQNASLTYTSTDGRWEGKGWIRNIQDEENITGKYVTSDTSGFYRNYFLTEPRIYGATVKYTFGPM